MPLQIEKNIPIPSTKPRAQRNEILWSTLESLAVGDSFLLPASKGWHPTYVRTAAAKVGIKLAFRTLTVKNVKHKRVWRIR